MCGLIERLQPLEFLDRDDHDNRPTMFGHCDRRGARKIDQPAESVLRFTGGQASHVHPHCALSNVAIMADSALAGRLRRH